MTNEEKAYLQHSGGRMCGNYRGGLGGCGLPIVPQGIEPMQESMLSSESDKEWQLIKLTREGSYEYDCYSLNKTFNNDGLIENIVYKAYNGFSYDSPMITTRFYEYDANNRISTLKQVREEKNEQDEINYKFTIDENERALYAYEDVVEYNGDNLTYVYKYDYDTDGRLVKASYYYLEDGNEPEKLDYEETFEYLPDGTCVYIYTVDNYKRVKKYRRWIDFNDYWVNGYYFYRGISEYDDFLPEYSFPSEQFYDDDNYETELWGYGIINFPEIYERSECISNDTEDEEHNREMYTDWDDKGNLIKYTYKYLDNSRRDTNGNFVRYIYTRENKYDEHGFLTWSHVLQQRENDSKIDTDETYEIENNYDEQDNLISQKWRHYDDKQNEYVMIEKQYEYDDYGNVIKKICFDKYGDIETIFWYSYMNKDGLITGEHDISTN